MDKIKTRIWSVKGNIDYYNFKSKSELPMGHVGDLAVVNHSMLIWNHYTKRWNSTKHFQPKVKDEN